MTDQQCFEEAEQAGFDLNLIDLTLSLTVDQRVQQHQAALSLVLELEHLRKLRLEDSDRSSSHLKSS